MTIPSDITDSHLSKTALAHDQASLLIVELSAALHTYGVAAHDLEESMTETAAALGLTANFFATPTSIFVSFGRFPNQHTTLLRVRPGDVNLEKLEELYELNRNILSDAISAAEGLQRVRTILSKPTRYGAGMTLAAFALATAEKNGGR